MGQSHCAEANAGAESVPQWGELPLVAVHVHLAPRRRGRAATHAACCRLVHEGPSHPQRSLQPSAPASYCWQDQLFGRILGRQSRGLEKILNDFNDQRRAVLNDTPAQAPATAFPGRQGRTPPPSRTQSRSVFRRPDVPPNVSRTVSGKTEMPILEFQNKYEQLCPEFLRVVRRPLNMSCNWSSHVE